MFELYNEYDSIQEDLVATLPTLDEAIRFGEEQKIEYFSIYRKNSASYVYCSY